MTAKELERLLALRTGFGAAHLDQTTRALRAAGLLPAGRRGRGARPLDGADVATVLIALTAADQPAKAPAAARIYARLCLAGGGEGSTFAAVLAGAATDAGEAASIRTVLVCRSWPMATISRPTGFDIVEERYLPVPVAPTAAVHDAPVFCGLSGRLLLAIADAMADSRAAEPCTVPA